MDDEISPLVVEIKAVCLRLLARREHSRQELLNKLQLKGYGKEDCSPVIEALTNQDWQSDRRYSENYARSCIQRGYGPIYIAYNLRQQGVACVDLETIVEEMVGSWTEQIEQVYAKKYGQTPVLDQKEWAKRSRFLLQRGFSQAMISALFDDL